MLARIPQLDAIRGIAILLVILHNQSRKFGSPGLEEFFASGWMGVDLFFVLSGLLITGILLDTRGSAGFLKNFYARRCLRIWPLYFSLIVFMFVVVPSLRPAEGREIFDRSSPWWAYPLFLQNFLVPNSQGAAGPLGVTWSLAIEEQFYLVWPFIVRYGALAQLSRITISVFCLSPILRLFLSSYNVDFYSNLFCRLDGLMAGALIAVLMRSSSFVPSKFVKPAWIALIISTPLAILTDNVETRWVVFSFSAVASTSLVFVSLYSDLKLLRRVMTNRFLIYTGTISYGLYLLHKIPFDAAEQALNLDRYRLIAAPILLAACFGIAALSWQCLEKPSLKLKRVFESRPVPVKAGQVAVARSAH
jgi:peptidoglycan/LPS O-acetylase OafA/YrhL